MYIKIGDSKHEATIQTRPSDGNWDNRESKAITLKMTYAEALETFVNDLQWSMINEYTDENNQPMVAETDMSIYAISGSITDNRDGTITIKMGKYKSTELMEIPLSVAPHNHKEALVWREAIEKTVQTIEDDAEALQLIPLYPTWESLVEKEYTAINSGFKFSYNDKLYKTIIANSQFVSYWIPGQGTESMYARIDEAHAGTMEDPIPYEGNMELVNGKYYIQNDIVYLCNRDTGAVIYNALADLVGIYVEVV
jgi:hypothetical protein